MLPNAPNSRVEWVSTGLVVDLTPHPGGKNPPWQVGHTPYCRSRTNSSPPSVCNRRSFFPPSAFSFIPHSGQTGSSPLDTSLQSPALLSTARSATIRARTPAHRLSISFSISRNVAFACSFLQPAIPHATSSNKPLHFSIRSTFSISFPSLFSSLPSHLRLSYSYSPIPGNFLAHPGES